MCCRLSTRFCECGDQPAIISLRSCGTRQTGHSMNISRICEGNNSNPCLFKQERSGSPEPTCVSMKSDWSMDIPQMFTDGEPTAGHSPMRQERSGSPEPSCVSIKSNWSMDIPQMFSHREPTSGHSLIQPTTSDLAIPCCMSMSRDGSMETPVKFRDGDCSCGSRLELSSAEAEVQKNFKLNLKKKFQYINEGMAHQGNQILLSENYAELYITEGGSGEVNIEHEVRLIEAASRRAATRDTQIKCNDIFRPLSEQETAIKTVLTKGVAGIGKTVSVHKFILDWTEGKANQDVDLIFPLPFRELNLMKYQSLSLIDLLHSWFKETIYMEMLYLHKVLFVFDGLDECLLPLDFQSTVSLHDVTVSAPVDVLLTNLITGNLFPSALIWITSRPAAVYQIPSKHVGRVTEVRGLTDSQKEKYFMKRIGDEKLAKRIVAHVKSSRSLYIMCHIPVFCWISAIVLESMLGEAESGEIPRTLTEMYTRFLVIQINIIKEKYSENQGHEEILLKLGQVAFQQLMKGHLIFYEEDLRECGVSVTEASVYSGVCTQIFREEFGLHRGKVYCFVHLSVQEHLAALYVHLTFMNQRRNVLKQSLFPKLSSMRKKDSVISDVHKSAVDQALQSKSGHLDLFLRFLLGLSVDSSQTLLQGLVRQKAGGSHNRDTVQYIKKKIKENPTAEKCVNLFHCLNELGDSSLLEEIQNYLQSGNLQTTDLSPSQWSAVVFVLLTSSQTMDKFNLREYTSPCREADEVLLKLMPVVTASRMACLRSRNLKKKSYAALASVLSSNSSCLRELNLSGNELGDSGVKLLCAGLESPHCKLETLKLKDCNVTDGGCAVLASALKSNPSHLRDLSLSWNKLGDSGVKLLAAELENPHCKLEILCLTDCNVSYEGCAILASALKSKTSHLRNLNLSGNKLGDLGVKLLCAGLENPHCKLETLRLKFCKITVEGCAALASALKSNPSHLKDLNLSWNKLGDSGVKLISVELENPCCKLETLRLWNCNVTDEGCAAVASALKSNHSQIRELDLSQNKLGDSGVKLLSVGLENPSCKLETLWLQYCEVTDEGCAALVSSLILNPSHLQVLDLSGNYQIRTGCKLLDLKTDEHFRLQEIRL